MDKVERVARAFSLRACGTENEWERYRFYAIEAIAILNEWEPIETCPPFGFNPDLWFRDGPRYLLLAGYAVVGSYGYTRKGKGRWTGPHGIINPTHWMPLPEPPK